MPNNKIKLVEQILANEWPGLERKEISYGTQFRLPGGTMINVYTTGKISVQGPVSAEKKRAEQLLGLGDGKTKEVSSPNCQPAIVPTELPTAHDVQ